MKTQAVWASRIDSSMVQGWTQEEIADLIWHLDKAVENVFSESENLRSGKVSA